MTAKARLEVHLARQRGRIEVDERYIRERRINKVAPEDSDLSALWPPLRGFCETYQRATQGLRNVSLSLTSLHPGLA